MLRRSNRQNSFSLGLEYPSAGLLPADLLYSKAQANFFFVPRAETLKIYRQVLV